MSKKIGFATIIFLICFISGCASYLVQSSVDNGAESKAIDNSERDKRVRTKKILIVGKIEFEKNLNKIGCDEPAIFVNLVNENKKKLNGI